MCTILDNIKIVWLFQFIQGEKAQWNEIYFSLPERRLLWTILSLPNTCQNYHLQNSVNLPMTLLAKDLFFRVARPRSPILTLAVGPVIKILSHFRSRWITGGSRVCKKRRPWKDKKYKLQSMWRLLIYFFPRGGGYWKSP